MAHLRARAGLQRLLRRELAPTVYIVMIRMAAVLQPEYSESADFLGRGPAAVLRLLSSLGHSGILTQILFFALTYFAEFLFCPFLKLFDFWRNFWVKFLKIVSFRKNL